MIFGAGDTGEMIVRDMKNHARMYNCRPVGFFGLVKNLTADGHYTSRVACSNDWATRANSALADFPACSVPEH